METANNNLATGKKVNSALDDPINFFAAQDHTYRASDLEMRKDEMSEGVQTITAANDGVEAILDLIDAAKSLAQSALTAEDQTEVNDLEDQFTELMSQIDDLAGDSGYKGVNLLMGTTEQLKVYFNEDGSSNMTVTGEDATSTGLGITAVAADAWWDGTNSVPSESAINATIDELDDARDALRTTAKTLSTSLSTIEIRLDFTSNMINTLEEGAGNLTNADTNEESANLLTLQTQQSLAINALSIASDAAQSVLGLFN
jgi:flagellin-like hook-associated protein FlgL